MRCRLSLLVCGVLTACGCSVWHLPMWPSEKLEASEEHPGEKRLVGDLAVPFGMFPVQVEGVGLVTGLHGTGSDPTVDRCDRPCWRRCKSAASRIRTRCWPRRTRRW